MKKWTTTNILSLKGKTAIVTGTGGLGYEDALALARAGATVIVAGRDTTKGQTAVKNIQASVTDASVSFEIIDLADLASVKAFADRMLGKLDKLDILVNNAGVMTPPTRKTTKDGFELQFGTNYLSHFALTAHLLPLLKKAKGRVISLSSVAARQGKINFEDLQSEQNYVPMTAYSQSKLACLMFAFELQKQSDANKWGITSIAAHPGLSRTTLLTSNAEGKGVASKLRTYAAFLFQPVTQGALPTLYAATDPEAQAGGYYGPHALLETRGYPTNAKIPARALDTNVSEQLWQQSEKLAGVSF